MTDAPKPHRFLATFWNILWDVWCVISIIGIWPRFIEPRLLFTTKIKIPIPDLPIALDGCKILFFSDIHISLSTSARFLKKVSQRIAQENPDLILIGGDFLTHSRCEGLPQLESFLKSLSCSHGVFACLGNHDYEEYVTLKEGQFVMQPARKSSIIAGFQRLFGKKKESSLSSNKPNAPSFSPLEVKPELSALLKKCNVTLLENENISILHNGTKLQLAGIGDVMAGKVFPEKAFASWDPRYPGVVISHNPDSWPLLKAYPGNLYLFGHTHGGQVNLPWMWKKLTPIINKNMKRGLFKEISSYPGEDVKTAYVSRGIGSTFPFRWFSTPEIVSLTLIKEGLLREKTFLFETSFQNYNTPQNAYTRTAREQTDW